MYCIAMRHDLVSNARCMYSSLMYRHAPKWKKARNETLQLNANDM